MPLFYCVLTLTLHRAQSPQQTEGCWNRRKAERTFTDRSNVGLGCRSGLFHRTHWKFFSSWSGLEICTLLFPHGLSLSPLSGSQQGNIVNWLYNKEKRIMHTCWYSVLFFSLVLLFVHDDLRCTRSWLSLFTVCITSAHLSWRKRKCQCADLQLCASLSSKCCNV